MVKFLGIQPSHIVHKKFDAHFITDGGRKKVVPFGAVGYTDYTQPPHDLNKKYLYQKRHAHDRLDEPMSPGALSWYILWTATSKRAGIENYCKKFGFPYPK